MDFRLLDPNAAARGIEQVNGWADAAAKRRAGAAIAGNDQVGAQDILNRNGLLGDAMNVRQNVWAEQNREIAAQERATKEEERLRNQQIEEEAREGEALGTMASNLSAVLQEHGPEAILPAFETMATTWLANGATQESIEQMRQALATNPEQFITAAAGAADQAARRYQLISQAGYIGSLDTRTGTITGQRLPQYKTVGSGQDLVEIGGDGAPVPSEAAAAPAGGGAASGGVSGEALLPAMVAITAQSESGNRERDDRGNLVTSPKGAQGRMQVMPDTNLDPGYGVRPAQNNSDEERTRVGRDYLAAMMRTYGNDPAKAWGAYNWGPGNFDRAFARHGENWLQHAPAETRAYVAQNLAALGAARPAPGAATGAAPAGPAGVRTIASRPDRPAAPRAPGAAWRNMTADEIAAAGMRPGTAAQINQTNGQTRVAQAPASGGGANGTPRLSPQDNADLVKLRNEARTLSNTRNLYDQMESLANTIDSGGIMAMPGAGSVVGAVDPNTRRFMQLTDQMTPGMRQGLPGAASDRDVAMFRSATPSIDKPREANLAAIAAGRAMATNSNDYVAFMEQWARSNGSLIGAQEAWSTYATANPLFTPGTRGMPQVVQNRVPWRRYFARSGAAPAPRPQAAPAPSGGGTRRRFNPATGRIE